MLDSIKLNTTYDVSTRNSNTKINSRRTFRATLVLGFLPQELLGTSMYEYYHHDDIPHLAESHKAALQASETVTTQVSHSIEPLLQR